MMVLGFLPVVPMTIVSALLMVIVSLFTAASLPSDRTLNNTSAADDRGFSAPC